MTKPIESTGTLPAGMWAIPGLDVDRAKRYSRVRLALMLGRTAAGAAELAWFAFSGRSARLRTATRSRVPDARLATPAYLGLVAGVSWLAELPLSYVGAILIERHFGLTKRSTANWLGDQAKGFGLALTFQISLGAAAYAVIRRRPHDWWLVLAGATVPLSVAMNQLGPVLLMPLFNRFEPLTDRELADRIRRLADRAGVRVADVYRMDMSRQTEKANAFFTGLGWTKRIVLADTLLDRFESPEIESVIAHELGHQVHGDMWRFIGLAAGLGFGGVYAASRLGPVLITRTTDRTHVSSISDEASLPLLGLLLAAIGFLATPVQAAVSRAVERRTDRFARQLTGNGKAQAAALRRLAAQNLADPAPSKPVVWLLASHPPIARRIAEAEAFAATHAGSVAQGVSATETGG